MTTIQLAGATSGNLNPAGEQGARLPATAAAAGQFVRDLSEKGTRILTDTNLGSTEKVMAFRELFAVSVEVDAIKRFVLGKYWQQASAEEKAEYRVLFEEYIIATYAGRIDDYGGETLELGDARLERENMALVHSRVMLTDSPPVAVDWRLRYGEEGWRIIDIVVEGISLAITQRAEFLAVIRDNGGEVEGLLAKLREVVRKDREKTKSDMAISG